MRSIAEFEAAQHDEHVHMEGYDSERNDEPEVFSREARSDKSQFPFPDLRPLLFVRPGKRLLQGPIAQVAQGTLQMLIAIE